MKSFAFGIAASIGLAIPSLAAASQWEIDSGHSTAEFGVKHMMVSTVKGRFGKVTGVVDLDDKDLTKSHVNVVIDATTIDTNEPKRDAHLKSPDFFDVAKYPTITFKSTKITKVGKEKYSVTGDLDMHGVTKPVVLEVEGPSPVVKNIMGKSGRGATATGKLNRKDWGLTWNKPLAAVGGVAVSDEVKLEVNVELAEKAGAEATPAAAAPAAAPVKAKAAQ